MRNKVAKQLRKDASIIAFETFKKSVSNLTDSKQRYWERHSPISIYRRLKKAYTRNLNPEF
jgi:hypothetical protein